MFYRSSFYVLFCVVGYYQFFYDVILIKRARLSWLLRNARARVHFADGFDKLSGKEGKDPYHEPTVLFACMLELFNNIGSDGTERKISGQNMHDWLRGEHDPVDRGLMFCRAKKGSWPQKQYCEQCKNNLCNCNVLPSGCVITSSQRRLRRERKTGQEFLKR
jgi:hypothetical protein